MFISIEERYQYAPSTLLQAWTDRAFLQSKFEQLEQRSVRIDANGDRKFVYVSTIYQASIRVSGDRRLPLKLTIYQCDRWMRNARGAALLGTWQVQIRGIPVNMSGRLRLDPEADGSTLFTVTGEVCANRMLGLGHVIERLAASNMTRTLRHVHAITSQWLSTGLVRW